LSELPNGGTYFSGGVPSASPTFGVEGVEALKELLRHSPREFGKPSTLWTLEHAAEVSFEEGITEERVSGETIRSTLKRLGVHWERAKRWISSPEIPTTKGKRG
jgi:hypothetical protein